MEPNGFTHRFLAPCYLSCCILLGGASAAGYVANALLQLLGLLIVVAVSASSIANRFDTATLWLLRIAAVTAIYFAVQLVPLPPAIWALLPGREGVAMGFTLVGAAAPWLPISVDPDATVQAMLALLPPVAMFLAIVISSGRGQIYAVFALVALTCLSILFGVYQRLQGPDSDSYLYAITNRGGVVAFFANRNHLATLCLMTLPFIGALAVTPSRKADAEAKLGRRMISGCIALFIAMGVIVVKSVAGWVLLLPTLVACAVILRRGDKWKLSGGLIPVAIVATIIAVLVAMFAPIAINDLNGKLNGASPNERRQSMTKTLAAARHYLPTGSGAGSFRVIYPQYEDPADASLEYVSHAHNDYVELLLETGLAGLVLTVALWWRWASHQRALWRRGSVYGSVSRAAAIAVLVPLAHSFVDYPLRTSAIAAVMAMGYGLMSSTRTVEVINPGRVARRRGQRSKRSIDMIRGDDVKSG